MCIREICSKEINLRIAMIGHKRYGSREGGVEVVVTELARRMVELGHEVTCYDRSGSDVMTGCAADCRGRVIDGVHVVPVKTIDKKGLAALSSSYFATRAAIKDRPDVIHYHAIGPSVPLVIAYFQDVYGRTTTFSPNGIEPKQYRPVKQIKDKWGLDAGSYLLYLGRLVPEKRPELLIEAFKELDTEKRLVIAGGGSDTSEYETSLRVAAQGDPRVLFTGFVNGEPLEELYSNCYAYVLPSDVEGMPMSLLEAMAYGRCCVTSDIPECADVLAGNGVTFDKGSADSLRAALRDLLADSDHGRVLGAAAKAHVEKTYNWDSVVERTLELYST